MPSNDIAVSVRGVSKAYTIAHNEEKHSTLAETVLARVKNPFKRMNRETFWALRDVSFEIKKGDVVGIIGRNGAGKSTLLKILSRITGPTKGEIDIYGRVGSLLEVGTGFHPELTGRENIFLNGAILGMNKGEIRKQFDAIVDFAGIEQFLDTPVKRYSSGMYVRLAFAVAAHLRTEILIVDEVLAVGDAEFQKKCLGKMKDVSSDGRTVLFVSHNMAAIRSLCSRAILLSAGAVLRNSDIDSTCERYLDIGISPRDGSIGDGFARSGSGELRCVAIRMRSIDGHLINAAPSGDAFEIEIDYFAKSPVRGVRASIDIDSIEGYRVTTLYSGFVNEEFDVLPGAGRLICRVTSLPLLPDKYRLNVMLGHEYGQCDFVRDAITIQLNEVDLYGTGRVPQRVHGAAVSRFSWRMA